MNDYEFSRLVRAAAEEAYARIERGENLIPGPNLDIDEAYAEAGRVSEFVRLCRNVPKQVQSWLAEARLINRGAALGGLVLPSFPVVYWRYLTALSQHKEIDFRNAAKLRELLVPKAEDHLGRGLKVLRSARRGHQSVHGTWEEKKEKWALYQAMVDKLHVEFPGFSHHKLAEIVGKELGEVSYKTIIRRTCL